MKSSFAVAAPGPGRPPADGVPGGLLGRAADAAGEDPLARREDDRGQGVPRDVRDGARRGTQDPPQLQVGPRQLGTQRKQTGKKLRNCSILNLAIFCIISP